VETDPPTELLFCDRPVRSVSQLRMGGGRATERQEAANRKDWPSTRITGSREEMGVAVGVKGQMSRTVTCQTFFRDRKQLITGFSVCGGDFRTNLRTGLSC
jgi:hypothetical protein